MKPILIVDPSCTSVHGHHLKSLEDLVAVVAPRTATVLVNARLPQGAFAREPELCVHRSFKATVYDEPGLGPRPNGRLRRRLWKFNKGALVAENAARFALTRARARLAPNDLALAARLEDWEWSRWRVKWPELEGALRTAIRAPVGHIIAPSADVELISGLADMRERQPDLRDAQIHARIITPSPALERLAAPAAASESTRATHAQRMAGVYLYVETGAMQRHLREAYGLASEVYPYLLNPPACVAPGRDASRATFGYFGGKRNEKGFPRLETILSLVAARRRAGDQALSFVIHASDARGNEADDLRERFATIAGPGLDIEFIAGPLSEAEYAHRFEQIDVALLPYTGARYALSGSGIVCEALAAGKGIVMTAGLSFADACLPEAMREAANDSEFADAILSMARDIVGVRAAAAERAVTYAAEVRGCALLKRLAE